MAVADSENYKCMFKVIGWCWHPGLPPTPAVDVRHRRIHLTLMLTVSRAFDINGWPGHLIEFKFIKAIFLYPTLLLSQRKRKHLLRPSTLRLNASCSIDTLSIHFLTLHPFCIPCPAKVAVPLPTPSAALYAAWSNWASLHLYRKRTNGIYVCPTLSNSS